MPSSLPPIELEFSRKRTRDHAALRPRAGWFGLVQWLSHWRETRIARRALEQAGDPTLVLDMPCGSGRFWPLLAEHPTRVILAADSSPELLALAVTGQSPDVLDRTYTFLTSAFAIDLPDNAVESIFCLRLLQHVIDNRQRLALLREMHRVTRDTLIVSLWVDGNYKAWRRARRDAKHAVSGSTMRAPMRCIVSRAAFAAEIQQAGFSVIATYDAVPHYALWRTYVLRKEPRP